MFGLGRKKKQTKLLVGIINGMIESFNVAVSATSVLKGKGETQFGDRFLAIILGFADSAGQIGEVDMEATRDALKELLRQSGDGPETFDRMMQISADPDFLEWQTRAGRAVLEGMQSEDQVGPMMELAEAYLVDQ